MAEPSIVQKKIADKIRKIRLEKGLTQEKLALEAGVNRAYIGYIETGKRKPSVETLEKIAKSLHVKLVDLFDD